MVSQSTSNNSVLPANNMTTYITEDEKEGTPQVAATNSLTTECVSKFKENIWACLVDLIYATNGLDQFTRMGFNIFASVRWSSTCGLRQICLPSVLVRAWCSKQLVDGHGEGGTIEGHWTLKDIEGLLKVKSSTVIEIDYFIVFIETDVIWTNISNLCIFPSVCRTMNYDLGMSCAQRGFF